MSLHDEITNAFGRSWQALLCVFRHGLRAPRPKLLSYKVVPINGSTVMFFTSLLVFVAAGFAVFDDDVARYTLTHKAEKTSVYQFFRATTDIGTSGWFLVTTALVGLGVSLLNLKAMARARRWFWANIHADMNFAFFTVGVTGVLISLIKNTIGRARPKHFETLGHLEFDFARFEADYASFPSGHSTTFGALCMVGFLLLPRKLWPFWLFLAVMGGVSRIMVGAHYASDVAAGLAFGSVLTAIFARWLAKRGVMFVANDDLFPLRKIRY